MFQSDSESGNRTIRCAIWSRLRLNGYSVDALPAARIPPSGR
jgi:hypothetical protein